MKVAQGLRGNDLIVVAFRQKSPTSIDTAGASEGDSKVQTDKKEFQMAQMANLQNFLMRRFGQKFARLRVREFFLSFFFVNVVAFEMMS